jgi:hypothetical protein
MLLSLYLLQSPHIPPTAGTCFPLCREHLYHIAHLFAWLVLCGVSGKEDASTACISGPEIDPCHRMPAQLDVQLHYKPRPWSPGVAATMHMVPAQAPRRDRRTDIRRQQAVSASERLPNINQLQVGPGAARTEIGGGVSASRALHRPRRHREPTNRRPI